ncbi:hypothetical protein OPKNFCMD_1752 [Methylobacterium crusticola]|uniref:Uncharacterized protein n=1 Tax=Methylobacterium crusticola TaxID=1697972 RepID=A0ABQ4QVW5_9HYPH|nr:hypothetical protein [Methylobacterium crusticola]GJD49025.1 hypothetical protein OPKNFCMD_1752 [Methylobacterium crusticola]
MAQPRPREPAPERAARSLALLPADGTPVRDRVLRDRLLGRRRIGRLRGQGGRILLLMPGAPARTRFSHVGHLVRDLPEGARGEARLKARQRALRARMVAETRA